MSSSDYSNTNKEKSTDFDNQKKIDDLISIDIGGRQPGVLVSKIIFVIAVTWALFQLYISTSLPYATGIGLLDDTQQRSIHLAFALFLGFCSYPAFLSSSQTNIPVVDWLLAALAAYCALYIVFFYAEISEGTGGIRTTSEIVFSVLGILLVLEITRRTLGIPLVIVTAVFIIYAFFGPYMPDLISHKGVSLNRMVDHLWLTTEGVFGLPLGVSSSYIFLFVLFGALLEKAGAGNFFIKLSFALLGHLRGGPAKAAVVSSGLTGLISGSAIANVVTTGTFTIPLMKRVGFPAEKASAIEVSASINGQIMPPVMGAAAFLMTEFVGISYFDVIKHAFLPAVISYIGLFYIVHLEALKMNLPMLEKLHESTLFKRVFGVLLGFSSLVILSGLVYFSVALLKLFFGEYTPYICGVILFITYIGLLWLASRYPVIEVDKPDAPLLKIPDTMPILMAGLYFMIPIVVLIWCLMIERLSPGYSVSWAILCISTIILTQQPIVSFFRGGDVNFWKGFVRGGADLIEGMASGSKNMVGIALAMGAAGIIVGVVSITGIGLIMTEIIGAISGGNVLAMMTFTAIMCMVLGMGLPTTANYIVVSSVMAQPFVTLAAQHGIIVPLIAVHLFVFYFGLISGTTPPVAVDAFAGAAVGRANPMKTAIQSFFYNIRTSILPFIFIFNPGLLLIGIDYWWEYIVITLTAVIAMLAFSAASKSYFLYHSRKWESVLLLVSALTLIHPGFWLDRFSPPFELGDPKKIEQYVNEQPEESIIRMKMKGENFSGDLIEKVVVLPLGKKSEDRLMEQAGMSVYVNEGLVLVDSVAFDKPASQVGIDFDWEILELHFPAKRMDKEWFYLLAALLILIVARSQLSRRKVLQKSND